MNPCHSLSLRAKRSNLLSMKVAFVLPMSLESPSGLRYLAMAKALNQRGYEVTLLALHHDLQPTTPRRLEQDGIRVQYVGQMHVRKVGNRKYYYPTPQLVRIALASTWRLMVRATQEACDLIHLGKPQPVNGLAGLLAGRVLRHRRLYLDCDDYEAESNRFTGAWLKRVVVAFEDGLPRFAAGLTTNTRFSEGRLVCLGVDPQRIAYVPNGVDRARFAMPSPAQVEALRRQWEVESRPVVGYVGSLSLTSHSVDLLLEALAQVLVTCSNAVLLLVGGGEDYDEVRRRSATLGLDRAVRFVGRVSPAEAPAYYALADVTVDPVRDDLVARARSPLKIVESLAVGTPVVTGDVGDRREMLADGQAGILVAPGSARALADGLMQILGDRDRAQELSRGAMAQREEFYWDRLVDKVVQLYERLG